MMAQLTDLMPPYTLAHFKLEIDLFLRTQDCERRSTGRKPGLPSAYLPQEENYEQTVGLGAHGIAAGCRLR
ncbi:hypothetical protein EVG20_g5520 [Dentipellis fragilis]|uniref:Uncharacterized protein n=1 Tax=Dentipellis fragilis TaxID=205917 RepID=A0A4Y9YSP3_9AGAM|nr:hypothetical protein EVG20_g5520 [Dentipellis fragilis]